MIFLSLLLEITFCTGSSNLRQYADSIHTVSEPAWTVLGSWGDEDSL
jgi:hypothetical protein